MRITDNVNPSLMSKDTVVRLLDLFSQLENGFKGLSASTDQRLVAFGDDIANLRDIVNNLESGGLNAIQALSARLSSAESTLAGIVADLTQLLHPGSITDVMIGNRLAQNPAADTGTVDRNLTQHLDGLGVAIRTLRGALENHVRMITGGNSVSDAMIGERTVGENSLTLTGHLARFDAFLSAIGPDIGRRLEEVRNNPAAFVNPDTITDAMIGRRSISSAAIEGAIEGGTMRAHVTDILDRLSKAIGALRGRVNSIETFTDISGLPEAKDLIEQIIANLGGTEIVELNEKIERLINRSKLWYFTDDEIVPDSTEVSSVRDGNDNPPKIGDMVLSLSNGGLAVFVDDTLGIRFMVTFSLILPEPIVPDDISFVIRDGYLILTFTGGMPSVGFEIRDGDLIAILPEVGIAGRFEIRGDELFFSQGK